jgi:hypothetical protein
MRVVFQLKLIPYPFTRELKYPKINLPTDIVAKESSIYHTLNW